MNKIKILYDVVKTMKDKENLNGIAKVEIQKDQLMLFSLKNEFEKNMNTGQTRAKICTELDYEGTKVKHESNTEFTTQGPCGCKHHLFMKHMHHHHTAGCGGIKGKLSKLAFALSLLNNMQIEEQKNGSGVISLNINEIPDEMKTLMREKIRHAVAHHHEPHGFMKEFCDVDKCDVIFNMLINQNNEVEKIVVTLNGIVSEEQNIQHSIKAKAELSFIW